MSRYGLGLFAALPFGLGLASVLLAGYHRPQSYARCLLVSWLSVLVTSLALLALAIEGLVCLVMAAPIAGVLAAMGGTAGYLLQRRPVEQGGGPAQSAGDPRCGSAADGSRVRGACASPGLRGHDVH